MHSYYICSNTEQKHITVNDDRAFAVAERKGDFTYSTDEEKDNQYKFKGGQNEITMNRIYDEEWICDYHMGWYPFDTQTCHMYLKPDGNSGEFIELKIGYMNYHGPVDLQQYFIRTSGMTKVYEGDYKGSVNVEIVLGRRLLGKISTKLLILLLILKNFQEQF